MKKYGDLNIALKSFSKDDLLVIFVPVESWSQVLLHELQEYVAHEKVENNVLILPSSFSINKIHFTGIKGKEVDKIDIEGDIINVNFVDKMSKDSENK